MRLLALVIAVAVAAFAAGRLSEHPHAPPPRPGSFDAGWDAAFSGFDGGWEYGRPYVVTVKRGAPGRTYRFASRRPLHP
jgi:hypothetical protein